MSLISSPRCPNEILILKMECKNCKTELETSKTKPRVFCSAKCRMAYNRGLLEEKITNKKIANGEIANAKKIANDEVTKISVQTSSTINRWGRDVREMDAKMLYSFIRAYEHDTWKDSPEFRELTERLKKPVKWLRANGYWIPNRLEKV